MDLLERVFLFNAVCLFEREMQREDTDNYYMQILMKLNDQIPMTYSQSNSVPLNFVTPQDIAVIDSCEFENLESGSQVAVLYVVK